MEAFANLVPAKNITAIKVASIKKARIPSIAKGAPKISPTKPTIVRPVGSELELEDQSRSDTDSEIDTE